MVAWRLNNYEHHANYYPLYVGLHDHWQIHNEDLFQDGSQPEQNKSFRSTVLLYRGTLYGRKIQKNSMW